MVWVGWGTAGIHAFPAAAAVLFDMILLKWKLLVPFLPS